ncbi:MAG TPA: DNA polymerase III subunit beta [Candidatus Dormibacteraeota bacterium]|nr:DNA polymerase III subunit beta [Candidatus Dormibacteraeota bacterium]
MPVQLAAALQIVSRAISTRSTLPILNNILLETTPQGLALTATNLEVGIRKVVPVEVLEEGSVTAPARLLTEFVASLPDQLLELVVDPANQTINLRCGRYDTNIKGIEADEFPPGPRPDDGDSLHLDLAEMLEAVEQTMVAASTDEARPVLTGILLQIEGKEVTMASTDGHRLAIRKLTSRSGAEITESLIVPARSLAELARAFKGEGDSIEILIAKGRNQVFFRAGTSEVTSRLIDGNYPNYAQVIPAKSSTIITAPTSELTQVLKSVSLFARDGANVIRMKGGEKDLTLSANTNEVGDSRAEMNADVDGTSVQVAFNAKYLLDALTVIGGDQVEIKLDGPLSPGLISAPADGNYIYVIMPVRVAM